MHFKQFYLGCLAQASYLVGDAGEAAVIDPRRDVDEYLREAETRGLKIKYVIETHLHADFVSGHRELQERSGAEIVLGAQAGASFPHRAVKDGDELRLGRLRLRFWETPGHTPESVTVLVIDPEQSEEPCLAFTGDTLFIGDVGRPDLVAAQGQTPEAMAGRLYDSLHLKLLTLPDQLLVYPAHGAGSLCGKNLSKDTFSTLGEQRRSNYALQPMPKAEFVRLLTADPPELPRYFASDVALNRSGARALASLPALQALSPAEVAARQHEGALVLDVRPAEAFGTGHVPGSVNVGLNGQFASWCGELLDAQAPLVLVAADEAGLAEARMRLARVGLENAAYGLAGGLAAWTAAGLPLAQLAQIGVGELQARLCEADLQVLDVRRPGEYALGHVPGAKSAPLERLERSLSGLDRTRPTAVICAGGYRSSAGASLLERHGFTRLVNVAGGTAAWIAAGYPVEVPESAAPCMRS